VREHEKIGSLLDKTRRLVALAAKAAEALGLSDEERRATARAAALAKADLTTDLVAEFPRLQGMIGGEYARRQGESETVCRAIAEHYLPRGQGDRLPKSGPGLALALAEKLDALACFFAAGFAPTGSADPYALRRHAVGIVRIVGEAKLRLSVGELLEAAMSGVPEALRTEALAQRETLRAFLAERFAGYLKERGHRYDLVAAVLAVEPLKDFRASQRRMEALEKLARHERFAELRELVERTHNISKALLDPASGVERAEVRSELLAEAEERALFEALGAAAPQVLERAEAGAYEDAALAYLDALAAPVHAFFAKVFVNAPDLEVRRNRLSLVRAVHELFAQRIADLRLVEGAAAKT
jgi:glycyl-tRNA synthetase beta subunit